MILVKNTAVLKEIKFYCINEYNRGCGGEACQVHASLITLPFTQWIYVENRHW